MSFRDKGEEETFRCALCGGEHQGQVKSCPEKGEPLRAVHRMGGKVLDDKYLVGRFIAEGGMGAVYEGVNRDIGRRVAIKFLHLSISEDPQNITQFENEARITASLGHRNIVDVLDMGVTSSGMFYIVMEYLHGTELSELIHQAVRLPYPWATDITIQILEALSQVHALGIVHRDLKPENVRLVQQRDGTMSVKILDFGVSCLGHRGKPDLTSSSGTVIGTPHYISPEGAMGLTKIDQRSDLYSVGIILYEMLSGSYPHEGESAQELLTKKVYEPAIQLGKHAVSVPPGLEAVVMWAIERDPEDRFADADEFIEALMPFRDPEPSGTVEPVAQDQATPLSAPSSVQDATRARTDPAAGDARSWEVDIQGIPAACDVYVDGTLVRERPITLESAPGLRTFRIEAAGFEPWQRTVNVHSDLVIFVELTRKSG